jgi:hypothetical protein
MLKTHAEDAYLLDEEAAGELAFRQVPEVDGGHAALEVELRRWTEARARRCERGEEKRIGIRDGERSGGGGGGGGGAAGE